MEMYCVGAWIWAMWSWMFQSPWLPFGDYTWCIESCILLLLAPNGARPVRRLVPALALRPQAAPGPWPCGPGRDLRPRPALRFIMNLVRQIIISCTVVHYNMEFTWCNQLYNQLHFVNRHFSVRLTGLIHTTWYATVQRRCCWPVCTTGCTV